MPTPVSHPHDPLHGITLENILNTRQIMTTAPIKTHSPHLLSAFDLRGLALRNRVVMALLTRARAGRERVPNDLMAEYYIICTWWTGWRLVFTSRANR